jgi:hypothetical protein
LRNRPIRWAESLFQQPRRLNELLFPAAPTGGSPPTRAHGAVMAIQTVEAWIHSVHRNFTDVIVFL